jgi:hypothetical protein
MDIDYRKSERTPPPIGAVKFLITKAGQGVSQTGKDFFSLTCTDLRTGATFEDRVFTTHRSAWKLEALIESLGLTIPDGGGFKITCDDLEGRIGFGEIEHRKLNSGRTVGEFKSFWSRTYAIEKDPSLAEIPDPSDAVLDSYTLPLSRKAKTMTASEVEA